MDITDFTKGINTDVDAQDGGTLQGTARDMSNADPYPGRLVKRDGTKAFTFLRADDETIPTSDEIVIQIETIYAPKAKADSVKDFPTASERCLNTDVTVILVKHKTTGKYRIYADNLTANVYEYANTPDDSGWIDGTGDGSPSAGDPYLIGRVGGVAIGNVSTIDPDDGSWSDPGVLWFGHIKRLACWYYNSGTTELEYMQALDEWRLSNAECYDAAGEITCRAVISDYQDMWNAVDSPDHPFYELFPIPDTDPEEYYTPAQALSNGLSPWLIGQQTRKFKVKMTAMFDGYQESRPLTWQDPRYATMEINHPVSGDIFGKNQLPLNWVIKGDGLNNQYLRVEIEDPNPRAQAILGSENADLKAYPWNVVPGSTTPLGGLIWDLELTWNKVWRETGDPADIGEDFYVTFLYDYDFGNETVISYEFDWDGPRRLGLRIIVKGGDAYRMYTPAFMRFLLGADVPSQAEVAALRAANAGGPAADYYEFLDRYYGVTSMEGYRVCREFWTISKCDYDYDPDLYDPGAADEYHPYMYLSAALGGGTPTSSLQLVFHMRERIGTGLLQIQPIIPRDAIIEDHTSTETTLHTGSRRLSGFRLYVMEDETDVDFRMIQEINLDYNVGDPNHGGTETDESSTIIGMRDGAFTGSMPSFYDAGFWILPYLQSNQYWGQYIGGANRKFLITDDLLTDREGLSLMSANLMRDETKTDKPTWKRGAVCNGRLFGIDRKGELQYCILAGGVVQYDIMPDAFHVSDGEEIMHIVSWRGQHHLVFTDQNLWRLSLGDGDELSWAILDSFVHQGTRLWKAIIDTPMGLIFPNENGIWLYDGNRPESIIKDKWEKAYLDTYAAITSEAETYGGYDPSKQDVHFRLTSNASYPEVWLFSLRTGGWRKYNYAGDLRPAYMTRYKTAFLRAFGAGDLRETNRGVFTDLGVGYGWHVLTQEVPPIDQTILSYWQYMGIRYSATNAFPPALRVHYEPYDSYALWQTKTIVANGARREYFFPLPLGISRNMRILVGQGSTFAQTNSTVGMELSSISFRGTQQQQWSGTR
ncbi:MAG: hypothetical protein IH600_15105 [Bacteroidetes bacterium]|nr:hypothetical protein [Bacteroidota bacterium]